MKIKDAKDKKRLDEFNKGLENSANMIGNGLAGLFGDAEKLLSAEDMPKWKDLLTRLVQANIKKDQKTVDSLSKDMEKLLKPYAKPVTE